MQKYLRNQCSPAELEELTLLLNEAEDDELDGQLRALWAKQGPETAANNVDWERIRAEVRQYDTGMRTVSDEPARMLRVWPRWVAAAVAVLAVGLAAYLYLNRGDALAPDAGRFAEINVPIQQTDTLLLPDGTRVTLNAGSSLRYPKAFDGDLREVYLEGEALFDVTRDTTKPFIVHAGQLRTRVLGTSFNVSAYTGQERAEVTVISGKVEVEETGSGRKEELLPEERVTYARREDRFEKVKLATTEQSIAWKIGRLAFDDTSLPEVAKQFYRKYGREMVLEGAGLQHCRLSLAFNQETPDDIIATIAAISNALYREEGDKIVIYGTGCPE